MTKFYAKEGDHRRCQEAILTRQPVMITGLSETGDLCAFTGEIQSIQTGETKFAGYPVSVVMPEATVTKAGVSWP